MPLSPLRISAQSERDLLTICEQSEEHLRDAYSRLASAKDHVISPKALRMALEQPLAAGVARVLVRQLVALRSLIDQPPTKTPSEAVGALTLAIKEKDWTEETCKKWERIAPIFEQFLAIENVVTTAKALELSLEFEHVLSSINILTDIRPVYSAARDKIIGGIICNRIRLKYQDESDYKSLSIVLDKDEIEQLKNICSDALTKIELASKMLNAGHLPSFITGEGYDDFD